MADESLGRKSGRKRSLTAAQLAHKRELDRRAQRTNREKTRNRITHLENLVEALRNPGDQTAAFVQQIDEQKEEIERLQGLLSNIAHLAGGPASSQASQSLQIPSSRSQLPCMSVHAVSCPHQPATHEPEPGLSVESNSGASQSPLLQPCDSITLKGDEVAPAQARYRHSSSRESISQMATALFSNTALDGLMWYVTAVMLRHILATVPPSKINFSNDDDIAIRAIFEGWGSVVELYPLDPGWQWLREVDERIYFHRSEPFRLMHLRNCRLIFLRQIFRGRWKGENVPTFFAPRPAEENIDHDPLIEYFPWPGVRERMVFSPTTFATTKFMENLRCEIDFTWSSNPHDLYSWDPKTERYAYSDMYHNRIADLRFYPASPDFFSNFPELKADIPAYPNALRTLRLSLESPQTPAKRKRQDSCGSMQEEEQEEQHGFA